MEKKKTLALTFFFSIFLFKSISGDDVCRPASCSPGGPQIRFPFRLRGRQPPSCGFPGFDLSCGKRNQTLINLPSSRSYIVKRISYDEQFINIDPDFCRRDRIVDFNLTDTPFIFSSLRSYTFFNCSLQNLGFVNQTMPAIPFPCLGSVNHTVIAVRSPGYIPARCRKMATISVPVPRYGDIGGELEMIWLTPFCIPCELEGKTCGLLSDDGVIGCFGSYSRGVSKIAKYGLGIGIGVFVLVCLIGLSCYIVSRTRNHNQSQDQSIDVFSVAVTPQPASSAGLDVPTIESYPKTVIGESFRLPKDDGTCPICLSDYEPKEELRTIPECKHYFHVDCIDKWLMLNATCPVCRNSPESSSLVTPCSSMSLDSSHAINQ